MRSFRFPPRDLDRRLPPLSRLIRTTRDSLSHQLFIAVYRTSQRIELERGIFPREG